MSSPLWRVRHPTDGSYEAYTLNAGGMYCSVESFEKLRDGSLVHRPVGEPMDPARVVFVGRTPVSGMMEAPTAEAAKLRCEDALLKAAKAVIAELCNSTRG